MMIPAHRALACADGVINYGSGLQFVPDHLMDDPEETKAALKAAYRRLLELEPEFDVLLLAHGEPVVGGARDALADFSR
jgi:glyoxylase-like metal-dependent hydrolase (beta-lactamase superfamily II)